MTSVGGVIQLTSVDAGAGGWDTKLRLNELGDEGDEGGDDGALRRVGQTDKQKGHVAENPNGSFGQVWKKGDREFVKSS